MKPEIDIDSLRTEHEPDEQWELRRSFMMEHVSKFDESELVSLAQLYTNIEFLGCSAARGRPIIVEWERRRHSAGLSRSVTHRYVTERYTFSKHLIPFQEADNALVTPSGLRLSMGTDEHLFSSGSHARLYPSATMRRITELAEKVSAKYREQRRGKLKRTFVQASDAAEQKAKRSNKPN
ncbi:Partner of xrn-2 protein 1 [Eumeta japonica]|uniref:Partner of xrn-2 protein 1 n=1 Tax=Eumeta variegata TaxID=151549 RepID=A0A4C1ZE90_EUMVA|nr:Partner of xrn-2 protein 1 [Eumeta japonica]